MLSRQRKHSFTGIRKRRLKQSRSFYQMVYLIIGIYALVVWLFFKRGASYRGKAGDVKLILFLAPLLFVCSYFSQGPSWFFALLLPVMVYVLLYPFLYIRNAGFYKFLYPVLIRLLSKWVVKRSLPSIMFRVSIQQRPPRPTIR